MNKNKFLNQKAKDMTVSELANAIRMKVKEDSCVAPKEEWKDVTKKCKIFLRDDGTGFVVRFDVYDTVFHLGVNGFYFPDSDYKAETTGALFKIMKKVK